MLICLCQLGCTFPKKGFRMKFIEGLYCLLAIIAVISNPCNSQILIKDKDICVSYLDCLQTVPRVEEKIENIIKTDKRIIIKAAKSEYEPFQLIINPAKDMPNVSLSFTDMKGSGTISKKNMYYQKAEYVEVKDIACVDYRAGFYPDPLVTQKKSNLIAGINNIFWVTIKTDLDTLPGKYCEVLIYWRMKRRWQL